MSIQKNIAATLRAAMAEKGRTQAEFSDELGIAHSSLQEYLKDGANPRADTIELLAEKLGMSPARLISGTDMPAEMYKLEAQKKTTHPLLEPVIGASLRLTRELFLLSDKLNALETEEKTDE